MWRLIFVTNRNHGRHCTEASNSSLGSVRHFVELFLRHLSGEHTCKTLMNTILDPALDKQKRDLFPRLQELNADHRTGRPIMIDTRLLAWRRKIRSAQLRFAAGLIVQIRKSRMLLFLLRKTLHALDNLWRWRS